MQKSSAVALLILAAFVSHSYAQSGGQQPAWKVGGDGNLTCDKWLAARPDKNPTQQGSIVQWVSSWVVSYNRAYPVSSQGY